MRNLPPAAPPLLVLVALVSALIAVGQLVGETPKPPVAITKEQITARIAVLEIQREDTVGRLNAINGAIADYKYLLETVEGPAKSSPAPQTAKAGEKK